MSKKGISPLIATVLLIGFTVALAIVIFSWIQGMSQKTMEGAGTEVGSALQCTGVGLDVSTGTGTLTVSNKGTTLACGFKYIVGTGSLVTIYAGTPGSCMGYSSKSITCVVGSTARIIPTVEVKSAGETVIVDCSGGENIIEVTC